MINDLPDISANLKAPPNSACLDWVGMEHIALPIYIENTLCPSDISAFVSLDDPAIKGIHMSRLYIKLLELAKLKTLIPPTSKRHCRAFSTAIRGYLIMQSYI